MWWFSETHVDFIPALYPNKARGRDPITRRDFLESRYDQTRILKNVNNFTFELPFSAARLLRTDLEKVGWRCEEFDSRTWILRGSDFRMMLFVQPKGVQSKIRSIGFDGNSNKAHTSQVSIGSDIQVRCDENGSGCILFE